MFGAMMKSVGLQNRMTSIVVIGYSMPIIGLQRLTLTGFLKCLEAGKRLSLQIRNGTTPITTAQQYRMVMATKIQLEIFGQMAEQSDNYSAFFSPSHFTTHEPSLGKPGALPAGAPSHPAAIIARA